MVDQPRVFRVHIPSVRVPVIYFSLQHLATLLITQQTIQQIQESLIPYLMFQRHSVKVKKDGTKISVKREKIKDRITRQEKLPVYQVSNLDTMLKKLLLPPPSP